jgi:hypothetical protein
MTWTVHLRRALFCTSETRRAPSVSSTGLPRWRSFHRFQARVLLKASRGASPPDYGAAVGENSRAATFALIMVRPSIKTKADHDWHEAHPCAGDRQRETKGQRVSFRSGEREPAMTFYLQLRRRNSPPPILMGLSLFPARLSGR